MIYASDDDMSWMSDEDTETTNAPILTLDRLDWRLSQLIVVEHEEEPLSFEEYMALYG